MSAVEFANREERPALVRFERRAVKDISASLVAGRSVSKDIDFALVTPAYSKDCVEYKVETWLTNMQYNLKNDRIPIKWVEFWKESYERWKNGQEAPLNGMPLRDSVAWSPAEIKNFIAMGFLTIEDLAEANDEGLKRLGMGGVAHKQKAQAIIQATKDHGPLVMENEALKNENSQLKGTIESLQNQMRMLQEGTTDRQELIPEEIGTFDILDDSPSPIVPPDTKSLKEQYKAKFGHYPRGNMKPENIAKVL